MLRSRGEEMKLNRAALGNAALFALKRTAALAVIVYALFLGGLYFFQRDLLYFPPSAYKTPQEAKAEAFREFPIKTEDGLDLKGWFAPSVIKPFTIVFFHGNADSLLNMHRLADPYIGAGYGFLLAEYRGYCGFPGHPSEQGFYADARAYMKALIATGVREDHIVLLAHSLGTGVATQMAREFKVGAVILMAPFLSIPKVAQIHYPLFPVQPLVQDRYASDEKISGIHAPLLIIHGEDDRLVPISQGRGLFELANEPKKFVSLPNRRHSDILDDAGAIGMDWLKGVGR